MSSTLRWVAVTVLLAAGTTAAAPPASKVAVRGTLSVVQEDDFERGRTARIHTLFEDGSGKRYTLRFAGTEEGCGRAPR